MNKYHNVNIGELTLANNRQISIIAGPCVLESKEHALEISGTLNEITNEFKCGFIYKTSFDKANRTSNKSPRGIGLEKAIEIFASIKNEINCPILTDVHTAEQCKILQNSSVVDVLQIPAFLCRQTDLLVSAGKTGLAINVKKGQFLAPWDMKNVVQKILDTDNSNILLCERGASFGYNTLVSDMRALPILAKTGFPVVFDATHSVQQPGGSGATSGGQREFAPILARAAVSIGVAAVFIETHQDPDSAPSDGPNMIPIDKMRNLLETLLEFDSLAKASPISI